MKIRERFRQLRPWKLKGKKLKIGETAVYLRDMEGLKWQQITKRLKLDNHSMAIAYYKAYKKVLIIAKNKMDLEQIEKFSRRVGIERGYVWLYENGFKQRVPEEVRERIENEKQKDAFEI